MIISNQKRLAADILSRREGRTVGIHRVWVNPDYLDEVTNAVQKDDIRQLIEEGVIKAKPLVGNSRGRGDMEKYGIRGQCDQRRLLKVRHVHGERGSSRGLHVEDSVVAFRRATTRRLCLYEGPD